MIAALRGYLAPDEVLLWTGRPDPAAEVIGAYLGCFGTALLLIGAAAGIAVAAGSLNTTGTTRIVLACLLALPLGIVAGGVMLAREPRRRRAQTAASLHAVTDRRLLTLIRGAHGDEIVFIAARAIGPVHLTPIGDGRGTITIETHSSRAADSSIHLTQSYAWFAVPDAATAYALIARLQDDAPA